MRWLATLLICLAEVLPGHAKTVTTVVPAQSYEQRKQTAFELFAADRPASEQLLLKLLEERSDDADVLLALGRIGTDRGAQLKPGGKRQKTLREARKYYVRAKEAGSTEPFIETVLAQINADGSEMRAVFSSDATVDSKIHDAERAFERKDFPGAIALYQQALAIDPLHYKATLYLGDAYFASEQYVPAITWFTKAAELDPNQETAYRYCGDALMRTGKKDLALDQYLQAVVANPYSGYSWRALEHACQALTLKPWVHAAKLPVAEVKPDKEGNSQIGLPENFTTLDVIYATARSKWQTEPDRQQW